MRLLLLIALAVLPVLSLKGQKILFMSGSVADTDTKVLADLRGQLPSTDMVVVLGNFLDQATLRSRRQERPLPLAELLREFDGTVLWVPGKSEWGAIRGNAADNLAFLGRELRETDTSWQLLPGGGCPGPYAVGAGAGLTLILLNTNWWLHEGEKPDAAECGLEDPSGVFVELRELLDQYDHSKVLLVGYHALLAAGPHGGYFSTSVHFLPPVAGSLYALYRRHIGGRHDLTNYVYEHWRDEMKEILHDHPDVTMISALEPSFQLIRSDSLEQVMVGNTQDAGYVREEATEAYSRNPGYVIYENGSGEFRHAAGSVPFSVSENVPPLPQGEVTALTFPDTVTARATLKLQRKSRKPGLLGQNYRDEWEALISDVPVFDIDTEKGGLKIVKQGGGQQTRSLRLEAADEKQYVLRSIEKYPEKAVPPELRNTLAADVVADEISASHPYGAFVIPPLAEAAGVYHTNPQLVYLPDDPRLGKYREEFGGGLYLFEERPDDDWRDLDSFGNSRKIMSTSDVIEKLQNDGDHIIDQEQTVRSRLFDIWIGDWDRHDDQWRWARFKPENEHDLKYYQPIPRDRDQAFFWSDGSLLRASSRRWGQPKFQGFHGSVRDVGGLEFNARHFDRTFLTGADRELWMQTARDLKARLTDEVIENAIRTFPPEIYALHGAEIIRKLKARRDELVRYAREYYLFLSEVVTVTASDKEDLVEVDRREDGSMEVSVWRISGKTEEKKYRYYHRVFQPDETREVRIFAFGDDDIVRITGDADKAPLLRVIGGKGDDRITDSSRVAGWRPHTLVYDKPDTRIHDSGEVKKKLSASDRVNRYDRYWFRFNTTMPLVTGGFNPDDGIFIGGGFVATRHGFRKDPFKSRHRLLALVAPRSGSYLLAYEGRFTGVIGAWDLVVSAAMFEPSYADFFYGLGNKTNFNEDLHDEDRQFYRVRYEQWILNPMLTRTSRNGKHTFAFGPTYRSVEIEEEDNEDGERFISLYAEFTGRGPDAEFPLLETTRDYVGLRATYDLDLRDNAVFPTEGLQFSTEVAAVQQIDEEENTFSRVSSAISFYTTFGAALRTTLAVRAGGQANFGDFEFYQAARLGGSQTLRGYRKLRFAGGQAFYSNLELRTKILQFDSFLFPAEVGILAFHDLGRVWEDNPEAPLINPDKASWHRGMGGGLWISPLGRSVISLDYSVSNDNEEVFFVRFGFMF